MDSAPNNESQGELFSEICCDPESAEELRSKAALAKSKSRKLLFDKCLSVALLLIVFSCTAYVLGYQNGKKSESVKKSESIIEEKKTVVIAVPDEQDSEKPEINLSKSSDVTESLTSETVESHAAESELQKVEKPALDNSVQKKWTVQVVTYVGQERAEKEIAKLKEDYEPFIIASGKYRQVCINKFAEVSEAKKFLPIVRKKLGYTDAYIRKIKS